MNSTILDNLYLVTTLILGMFSIYINFYFMNNFGRKIYKPKSQYIVAFICFWGAMLFANTFFGSFGNIMVSLGGTLIIGHYLYNNDKIYLLYYGIYIIFFMAFQIIGVFCFEYIANKLNLMFINIQIYSLALSSVVQLSNYITTKVFIFFYKNKNLDKITLSQYLMFLILPLFSILYIVTLLIYVQMYMSAEDISLLVLNVISIIVLNIVVTNVFQAASKNNELKSEILVYEKQSKMQYEYYNSLEKNYTNSRKVIHDVKNHIQALEHLYSIDKEKAKEYSKDLYLMLDSITQKKYTENRVLNIILNDKIQRAEEFRINVECKIGNIYLDFIKDIDLTTIFSNLLDNAIEASSECIKSKEISIVCDEFNGFIVLNISNTLAKKPIEGDKGLISNKSSKRGFGLNNVKKALEKYEGNLRIEYDNEIFKVNIVIPTIS